LCYDANFPCTQNVLNFSSGSLNCDTCLFALILLLVSNNSIDFWQFKIKSLVKIVFVLVFQWKTFTKLDKTEQAIPF